MSRRWAPPSVVYRVVVVFRQCMGSISWLEPDSVKGNRLEYWDGTKSCAWTIWSRPVSSTDLPPLYSIAISALLYACTSSPRCRYISGYSRSKLLMRGSERVPIFSVLCTTYGLYWISYIVIEMTTTYCACAHSAVSIDIGDPLLASSEMQDSNFTTI